MSLEDDVKQYTTDELLAEIVRRRNASTSKPVRQWCGECAHFKPWPHLNRDAPKSWVACAKGHAQSFRMPEDWEDVNGAGFGFYRRVCADRASSK